MVQIIIPTYNALTQAAGDGHVDRLMALLPTTGDALTIEGFEATALGAFHAAGLFLFIAVHALRVLQRSNIFGPFVLMAIKMLDDVKVLAMLT